MNLQKIVFKLSKAVAAISAAALMLTCLGAYSASAATTSTFKPIEGSALTCSLTAKKTSNSILEVTMNIINAPAIKSISVGFNFSGMCSYVECDSSKGLVAPVCVGNTVNCGIVFAQSYSKSFTITCKFKVANSDDDNVSISAGIAGYESALSSEPKMQPIDSVDVETLAEVTDSNGAYFMTEECTYLLGDATGDGLITEEDARYALIVAENAPSISLNKLNSYLYNSSSVVIPSWVSEVSSIACAEVIDVNNSKTITANDAQAILQYCSVIHAGGDNSGSDIGNSYTKTITVQL